MSTIKANDIQNASGGIPTVKGQQLIPTAWVNFNGTGTVAIRDSENVSSIVDNGTGDYTINFATNMSDTNYAFTGASGDTISSSLVTGDVNQWIGDWNRTVSSIGAGVVTHGNGFQDSSSVSVVIMGGQA